MVGGGRLAGGHYKAQGQWGPPWGWWRPNHSGQGGRSSGRGSQGAPRILPLGTMQGPRPSGVPEPPWGLLAGTQVGSLFTSTQVGQLCTGATGSFMHHLQPWGRHHHCLRLGEVGSRPRTSSLGVCWALGSKATPFPLTSAPGLSPHPTWPALTVCLCPPPPSDAWLFQRRGPGSLCLGPSEPAVSHWE